MKGLVGGLHFDDTPSFRCFGSIVRRALALEFVGARKSGVGLHLRNGGLVLGGGALIPTMIDIEICGADRSGGQQSNYSPCRQLTAAKQFRNNGDHVFS